MSRPEDLRATGRGSARLRRSGLFPLGEYGGRPVLVSADDGAPWILRSGDSDATSRAVSIGAWAGALILGPVLSLLASATLGASPSPAAVLLAVVLAAAPVAALLEFGAVRQRLEFEAAPLDAGTLLDLDERSSSQRRVLLLLAPCHLLVLLVLLGLTASTARAEHLIASALALGLAPMSLYALRAALARRRWARRWRASTSGPRSTTERNRHDLP